MIPITSEFIEKPSLTIYYDKEKKLFYEKIVLIDGVCYNEELFFGAISKNIEIVNSEKYCQKNLPNKKISDGHSWQLKYLAFECRKQTNVPFPAEKEAKKIGEYLNSIWEIERCYVQPNSELDLFYAKARIAGVWGGRPFNNGFVLLLPSKDRDKIMTELFN